MTRWGNNRICKAICLIIAVLSLLALSSCGAVDETPTPEPTIEPTPTLSLPMKPTPTPTQESTIEPTEEPENEIWVYPEEAYYINEELGIAIEFPESWVGHLVLVEDRYPTPVIRVCCREVAEAEMERTGVLEYAFIFCVVSEDKDEAWRGHHEDPTCFTFLCERDDILYYYSNARGRITGVELWLKDVWAENSELLTEMVELYDKLIDKVEIL